MGLGKNNQRQRVGFPCDLKGQAYMRALLLTLLNSLFCSCREDILRGSGSALVPRLNGATCSLFGFRRLHWVGTIDLAWAVHRLEAKTSLVGLGVGFLFTFQRHLSASFPNDFLLELGCQVLRGCMAWRALTLLALQSPLDDRSRL